jgi:hypothetical protein
MRHNRDAMCCAFSDTMTAPAKLKGAGRRAFMAAAVISAVGSTPAHVAPLVIALLISRGDASALHASSVVSALVAGQMISAFALPVLLAGLIKRWQLWLVAAVLVAGAAMAENGVGIALFAGWFLIGIAAGALQYSGMVAAAVAPRPRLAFAFRLSAALILSGTLVVAFGLLAGNGGYQLLVALVAAIMLTVMAVGACWYRPEHLQAAAPVVSIPTFPAVIVESLAWVALLFAALLGLLSFIIEIGARSGFAFHQSALALGILRVVVGILSFAVARRLAHVPDRAVFMALPVLLALATVLISVQSSFGAFFAGIFLFEINLNLIAPRFIGAVAVAHKGSVGIWLTAATLVGGALGPVLYGYAADTGALPVAIAFTALAAFIPYFVVRWRLGQS